MPAHPPSQQGEGERMCADGVGMGLGCPLRRTGTLVHPEPASMHCVHRRLGRANPTRTEAARGERVMQDVAVWLRAEGPSTPRAAVTRRL